VSFPSDGSDGAVKLIMLLGVISEALVGTNNFRWDLD